MIAFDVESVYNNSRILLEKLKLNAIQNEGKRIKGM